MRKVLLIMTLLLAMVTQGAWAQLGRVLATDGKYYKTVTAATNAGTTASGMIVYWGDGDTSDNTYNQGLAIALSDVVNNGQWGAKQQDVTGITDTGSNAASSMVDLRGIANTDAIVSKWPTGTYSYAADHCASMSTARPSSSSDWFLPSQGQFVLMMNSYGAGYGTSTSYAYDNVTKGAVVTAINNALTNAGGTALSNGRYWTSTEINIYAAGDWSASNSSFGYNDKPTGHYVRAMFAFSGATAAEYTVSYNANGGSGAPDDQTKDGGIDLTLSSTVPTRDGYTFAGWATSADGAVAYSAGGSYTANDDIVLYAQWTPVTYNAALATGTPTGWSITPTTAEEGSTVTVAYTGQHRVKSVRVRGIAKLTCEDTDDVSFSGSEGVNSTKTKVNVSAFGGTVSVSSADESKCTVSYSEGTITITRKTISAFDDVQITVSVTPSDNFVWKTANNVTFNVSGVAAAPSVPDGAINGKFSVSATKQVYFSKGNLRYVSGTWSFFDNQYDYYTSYSANTWDKFGWSTSATTYGMNISASSSTYSGNFVDWGNNSDLQTALGTGWFTLSSAEWTYLFNTRSASTVGGTADGRYAKAKVNDVQGVILFPDTYTHPDGVTAPVGVNAGDATGWNGNNYTFADWTKMESAGCVFLPAAGYRIDLSVTNPGTNGYYWSATPYGTGSAYSVLFGSGSLYPAIYNYRYDGCSVRLVREVTE